MTSGRQDGWRTHNEERKEQGGADGWQDGVQIQMRGIRP